MSLLAGVYVDAKPRVEDWRSQVRLNELTRRPIHVAFGLCGRFGILKLDIRELTAISG